MAIKYLAGNRITGLSGDTKPTNVPTDSEFTETDFFFTIPPTLILFLSNSTNNFISDGDWK